MSTISENTETLTASAKAQLFQAMEEDGKVLGEALDAMFTIVVSDPELTTAVAALIEVEYPQLYLAIGSRLIRKDEKEDKPACCIELFGDRTS